MKAIETKFVACTDTQGARIKCKAKDNKAKYYPYPHEYNEEKAHKWCALQYAHDVLKWDTLLKFHTGYMPNETYAHVPVFMK